MSENTYSNTNTNNESKPIFCLPGPNGYNEFSSSITKCTGENTVPNENGHNEKVLKCLPGPTTKRSECTASTESTDAVYVLYERVSRLADEANTVYTHDSGQKKALYSLATDSYQTEKTEEEAGYQEPIKDQVQTFGKNTPKTTETQDAFSTFIQNKVTTIQYQVKAERARNIQEAVVESLKYYLNEVEKLEPLFRVSELLQVGSYAEGTKVFEPDEFDFLAVIDILSRAGTVVLEPNPNGLSVTLALAKDVLNSSLCNLCGENGELECFNEPHLHKSYHAPAKFGKTLVQAVRNSFFDKVFKVSYPCGLIYGTPLGMDFGTGGLVMPPVNQIALVLNAVEFKTPNVFLRYKLEDLDITVDLSPAIRYHKTEDCIDREKFTCPELLNAVLKHGSCLLLGNKRGGFRVSITECEVMYMQKILKTKHKLLYIFLKYMCSVFEERVSYRPFTSYMLKNICIHHDNQCMSESETLKTCSENIIQDIISYCAEEKLPSILNKDVDVFFSGVSVPDFNTLHLRRHFLMALQTFHNLSGNIISSEMLENVLKYTISQSLGAFDISRCQPSCEACEINVTNF